MSAAVRATPPADARPQAERPAEVAIEVRGVSKVFGSGEAAVRALDDVSVAIRENEFFTLLGPSGCGKTTLLRLIAGFEHPSRGRHPAARRGHLATAAVQAAGQHRVPDLRAVPAHDASPRTSASAWRCSAGRRRRSGRAVERMLQLVKMTRAARTAAPASSPAASSSAWRWPARWRRSREVLLLDEPLSALDSSCARRCRSS